MFQTNVVEKTKTRILYSIIIFPPENLAAYDVMWKNMVEPERPQMIIQYGKERCDLHAGLTTTRIQTHTHNM